jgi:myosin heavy subunit
LVKAGGARASATAFMVKHSFADIMYECEGFVTQNKQSHLPDMALTTIGACSIPFVAVDVGQAAAALANPNAAEEAASKRSSVKAKGPSTATFLMTKTRNMMNAVLEEVAVTDKLTYALCIATAKSCKENATGLSAFASAEYVKDQCKYFALANLVAFAQKGFPYIKPYLEFYQRFRLALAYDTPALPYIAPENERVIAANAELLSKALVQNLLPLLMQVTTTGKQSTACNVF